MAPVIAPKATSTGVVQQNESIFSPNQQMSYANQDIFPQQSNPFAYTPATDGAYGSTAGGFGVNDVGINSTFDQPYGDNGFSTMNQSPQLNTFQQDQAKRNNWSYEEAMGSPKNNAELLEQGQLEIQGKESALLDDRIKNANSFDWMGGANTVMSGLNTAMQVGMYGDRKDYMKNVNKGLEQNMRNAQQSHDTRQKNTASYGSAFSNA